MTVSRDAEIRMKVATARQVAPYIAADTADRWIAEGIPPEEASERLYDMISAPIEASKIVTQYRATKGKA